MSRLGSRGRRLRRWVRARVLRASAWVWRRLMFRTTVVAITGSVGKTTTKECLAAILRAHAATVATQRNQNDELGVPRTLLHLRPWHRYAVVEIGTAGPGTLRGDARLARPHVGIVLSVASTHTDLFATLDDTAAEKAQLVAALPRRGLAILNADDPRVARMAGAAPCRVLRFGSAAGLDARADAVAARWPERLSLTAHVGAETQAIQTRLVGTHWVSGILAALLAARSLGIGLADAARALAGVEPFAGRLQPVALPNGAVVIRDEMNSAPDTWQAALAVLRNASARRRVLVASDLSDSAARPRDRARQLGDWARETADAAFFVGEHAERAMKRAVSRGMAPEHVAAARDVRSAAARLATWLQPGDVVLLKGRATHHLSRIVFAQLGEIGCWTTRCRKRIACDHCPRLRPGFDLAAFRAAAGPGSR